MENITSTLANLAVGLVALLHCYFMVLEMFFWDRPLGLRTFCLTAEFAQASKALAANQGLYNGFLAAGLFWGMLIGTSGDAIKIFFLCCVIVAGLYGAYSVGNKMLWVQAVPGLVALGLVLIS